MVGKTLGHYRILDKIGAGGMGEVYRAEDLSLKRKVALKTLPQNLIASHERMERFRREAEILAALEHPGIVAIYSLEEADGQRFLTMQYVDGLPMSRAIPRGGFDLERLFRLAILMADAVSAAHEKGVVHRDLKPGNIMISGDSDLKVLDFGLAKLNLEVNPEALETEVPTEALTGEGTRIGTLPYMSPEQVRGERVDHRSDLFSLGVILYQMATGEYPFQRGSSADLASSILRDRPSSVDELREGLPHHLGRIIRNCLEKDPDKRLQSSKDLRNALEDLQWEVSSVDGEAVASASGSRSRWWAAGMVMATIVAAVFASLYFLRTEPDSESPVSTATPLYLAVEYEPSFSGSGTPEYFRRGITHLLEDRLEGLSGVYLVKSEDSPRPDFIMGVDARRVDDSVNVAYRVTSQPEHEAIGGEILRGSQSEIFEALDRIGQATAELLEDTEDTPVEYRTRRVPTEDLEALDMYLVALGNYQSAADPQTLEEAAYMFAQAAEADRGFDEPAAYRGLTLLRLSRQTSEDRWLQEAKDACSTAVVGTPDLPLAHYCMAEVERLSGRYLESVDEYRLAFELGSRDPRVLSGARVAFSDLGRPQSEEDFWRSIIATDPAFWGGHSLLGRYFLDRGEEEVAIEHYGNAIRLAPTHTTLYTGKFGAEYALGRFWEGIDTLERSLQVDPEDHRMWGNLGSIYFLLRRFDEAISAHQSTVRLNPEDYRAHAMLGRSLFWAPGRREESTTHLRQAINLCEVHLGSVADDADGWLLQAWYQAMIGSTEQSLETLSRALFLRPNDAHFFYLAGLTHNLVGDEDVALGFFERAVSGGFGTAELRTTIEVDNLRQLPRFQELITGR